MAIVDCHEAKTSASLFSIATVLLRSAGSVYAVSRVGAVWPTTERIGSAEAGEPTATLQSCEVGTWLCCSIAYDYTFPLSEQSSSQSLAADLCSIAGTMHTCDGTRNRLGTARRLGRYEQEQWLTR
jgi:hypothetical protein